MWWAPAIGAERICSAVVPAEFGNFFVACASAAGALIGLLFVAISISPEKIVAEDAPVERQAVAASAFSALANAFIIALGALIPHINIGSLVAIMGLVGMFNTLAFLRTQFVQGLRWQSLLRSLVLLVGSAALYIQEIWQGVALLRSPSDIGALFYLSMLLIVVFGIGLIRAWELLGARRFGPLAWLNPLYNAGGKPQSAQADGTAGTPGGAEERR